MHRAAWLAGLVALASGAGCRASTGQDAAPPPPAAAFNLVQETWAPAPWAAARDASLAPFAPRVSPDHVVVMRAVGENTRQDRRTVRRHGDWARVDVSDLHGSQTHYVSLRDPVSVNFSRRPDGRYASIYIRLNNTPYGENAPPVRPTGERDSLLGETCAVWDITARVGASYNESRRLSCVTDDGIELWHRYEGLGRSTYRHEMRAVSLSREPVPGDEVTPPSDLLDPARWPIEWPASGATPSIDVLMDNGRDDRFRIEKRIRRLGDIERTDEQTGVQIEDRGRNAGIGFVRDADGRYQSFAVSEGRESAWGDPVPSPAGQNPDVQIAGETCSWFHMTPNVSDYSRSACLTADGVPLAERINTRGGGHSLQPRSVSRGQTGPQDFRLPEAVVNPANWGLDGLE
jgi:hypothetical protein